MKARAPFIHRPSGLAVPAHVAMDMVTYEGAHCHQFDVNGKDAIPDVETVAKMIEELALKNDGSEAYLAYFTLQEAMASVRRKAYGVASTLAKDNPAAPWDIIAVGQNHRTRGDPREYMGHAETCMVQDATPYRQKNGPDGLAAFVNLCPCPGCMGPLIDAHIKTVLIGTVDPRVGAAFARTEEQKEWAWGVARMQVVEKMKLVYRAPNIADNHLRARIHLLCWDVFHATRGEVHKREHGSALKE
ncbi:MAG TPA: deaminase [Candidatus Peribacteria bacterium]|nr:deaminase [Candidatus Peribacteria bacterium]